MFAHLKGSVTFIEDDSITIDINGVGYLVYVPSFVSKSLTLNVSTFVYIQTIVKEDSITLFGFANILQKNMFNLLITVQGIGVKLALVLMSAINIEDIQHGILSSNADMFKIVPGIGAKVSVRLVNELKDKIIKMGITTNITENSFSFSGKTKDATDVLLTLGYNINEINKTMLLLKSSINESSTSELIIKEALAIFAQQTK